MRANNSMGAGDASTDPNPTKDPNDYLSPIAGNKFYMLIAVASIIVISIVLVMAQKKQQ